MENSQIDFKTCKIEPDNTIKNNKKRYNVDSNKIYYDKAKPYLFFIDKNPNPIEFLKVSNYVQGKPVNSNVLNDLLETKVIKDMVNSGQDEKLMLILLGIVIVLALLNFMTSAGYLDFQSTAAVANATKTVAANGTIIK